MGVLPSAFYTPETRLGAGAFYYVYFNANKLKTPGKKSNAQSYASYTLNKQFAFENDYQIWLRADTWYLTGSLDYSRFPEFFYGIGNDTKEQDRVMVSFDVIRIKSKNLYSIGKQVYGGLYFQHEHLFNQNITLLEAPMTPMCDVIPGGMGFVATGLGPVFIVDKRDNPLNPAKGSYLETSLQCFNKAIGSQYHFTAFVADARKYHTFYKKIIWNANAYVFFNKGDVPYRMLPAIGGARFLRGYYRGRFRDQNLFIAQQELRMPVYKWLGVAMFGGIGAVSEKATDLLKHKIHYDYGVGLRIRINKKENTNLRLDYGITKDSQGLYFVFAEAF